MPELEMSLLSILYLRCLAKAKRLLTHSEIIVQMDLRIDDLEKLSQDCARRHLKACVYMGAIESVNGRRGRAAVYQITAKGREILARVETVGRVFDRSNREWA